ncbi:GIY-YIG nuclease family protein [Acidisoma cellulosilytica]|uniref:GIY-YIG nuclease family protein n=1 Tax=Acidisoma cellulosilyticum TaxID=2802395 RepID=A0A963YYC2_9PROT|nr:GIY-YIG nuclease family protein [Acidisoma cellulosilyticum]MCB8879220.1 GIY-YIG nuclease family protein [Acidisoma cellulosilyticum]
MVAWVYIVSNQRNGTLYIGVTAHLAARIHRHKSLDQPGFTQRYKLTRLVYAERHDEILRAIQREKSLKRWPRTWKLALIEQLNPDWDDLFGSLSMEI